MGKKRVQYCSNTLLFYKKRHNDPLIEIYRWDLNELFYFIFHFIVILFRCFVVLVKVEKEAVELPQVTDYVRVREKNELTDKLGGV